MIATALAVLTAVAALDAATLDKWKHVLSKRRKD